MTQACCTRRRTRPHVIAFVVAVLIAPAGGLASAAPPESVAVQPGGDAVGSAGPEVIPGQFIVQFVPGSDAGVLSAELDVVGAEVASVIDGVFPGAVIRAPDSLIDLLADDPRVAAIEPDQVVQLSRSSEQLGVQTQSVQSSPSWGLDRIDQRVLPLSGSFTEERTGAVVTAYVVDSGIRSDHTDLASRVLAGYDAIGGGTEDCHGHGTHVAALLGGTTYGVAKQVSLRPVRVVGCDGTGSASSVINGLAWIKVHHSAGQPAIANVSVGSVVSSSIDAATQAVIDDGVTVVAAAGNDGASACEVSPARGLEVITVAATDEGDVSPAWSNYGSCVDLFAPGVRITSAGISSSSGAAMMSGTSQASPHVAGLGALVLSETPDLSPAEVASTILADATTGLVGNARSLTPNRLLYTNPPPAEGAGFVAVTPCRVLDTRVGSPLVWGSVRSFQIAGSGSEFAAQGGKSGGCGIPDGALAVEMSVTAVSPTRDGFFRAWPAGVTPPQATFLNYTGGQRTTNTGSVALAPTGLKDLTVGNYYGTVHYVIDVQGYYTGG